jgi:hypothetical protein
MMRLDWGEGTEWRATTTGLRGLPEENQDKHLQTILQIGRNIIYMVQLYKSVTLGQLIFICNMNKQIFKINLYHQP